MLGILSFWMYESVISQSMFSSRPVTLLNLIYYTSNFLGSKSEVSSKNKWNSFFLCNITECRPGTLISLNYSTCKFSGLNQN